MPDVDFSRVPPNESRFGGGSGGARQMSRGLAGGLIVLAK